MASPTVLFNNLVDRLRGRLPEVDCINAADLVAHQEFGVALELLCEQLIEHDVPLASADIDVLWASAQAIGMADAMQKHGWTRLKTLQRP